MGGFACSPCFPKTVFGKYSKDGLWKVEDDFLAVVGLGLFCVKGRSLEVLK
jgi:hypothetical protein